MAGSLWRIAITPLDTLKTTLQVQGSDAYDQVSAASKLRWLNYAVITQQSRRHQVMTKVKSEGIGVLYQGALANALASFVGSYPW